MNRDEYDPFADDSDAPSLFPDSSLHAEDPPSIFGEDTTDIFGDDISDEDGGDDWTEGPIEHTDPTPSPPALVSPEPPEPPAPPAPPSAPPTPRIIRVEDNPKNIDDLLADVSPVDFGDFTPRTTRFVAPNPDEVLNVPSKNSAPTSNNTADGKEKATDSKENRAVEKREEKLARRAAKVTAKEAQENKKKEKQKKTTPAADTRKKNHKASTVAAVTVLLAVLGGGVMWINTSMNSENSPAPVLVAEEDTPPQTPEPSSTPASTPTATPQEKLDSVVEATCSRSKGSFTDGDSTTAEGAIRGFNHGYFAAKDAKNAASYLDDGLYDSLESLQVGIDHPENGDAYCVTITPSGGNVFEVGVTEFVRPDNADDSVVSWRTDQTVTVRETEGEWKIVEQVINTASA